MNRIVIASMLVLAAARHLLPQIVLCGLIALTPQSAKALELKVGDRIPAVPGEAIIVGNDGGLKFQRQVLDFGQVCHVNGWIKNWFLVTRIVADWTLIELVGPSPGDDLNIDYPSSIAEECPLGTETTRPVTEMRARLNAYAKESDSEFIESLRKPANTKKSEEANAHADIGVVASGVSIQRPDSRLRRRFGHPCAGASIVGACAASASGHEAGAPPSNVMNWRRFR